MSEEKELKIFMIQHETDHDQPDETIIIARDMEHAFTFLDEAFKCKKGHRVEELGPEHAPYTHQLCPEVDENGEADSSWWLTHTRFYVTEHAIEEGHWLTACS